MVLRWLRQTHMCSTFRVCRWVWCYNRIRIRLPVTYHKSEEYLEKKKTKLSLLPSPPCVQKWVKQTSKQWWGGFRTYPGGGGSPWLADSFGDRWSPAAGGTGETSLPSSAASGGGVGAEESVGDEDRSGAGVGAVVGAGAGAGGGALAWTATVVGGALTSSGSCCLEGRCLTSWGRGKGGAAFWMALRMRLYPVSFRKLLTAWTNKRHQCQNRLIFFLLQWIQQSQLPVAETCWQ